MGKRKNQLTIFLVAVLIMLTIYYVSTGDLTAPVVNKTTISTTDAPNTKSKAEQLREEINDQRNSRIAELRAVVSDSSASSEEKANALIEISEIENLTVKELALETSIKSIGYEDVFVQITEAGVTVNVYDEEHSVAKANDVMQLVRSNLGKQYSITVYFQNT